MKEEDCFAVKSESKSQRSREMGPPNFSRPTERLSVSASCKGCMHRSLLYGSMAMTTNRDNTREAKNTEVLQLALGVPREKLDVGHGR